MRLIRDAPKDHHAHFREIKSGDDLPYRDSDLPMPSLNAKSPFSVLHPPSLFICHVIIETDRPTDRPTIKQYAYTLYDCRFLSRIHGTVFGTSRLGCDTSRFDANTTAIV